VKKFCREHAVYALKNAKDIPTLNAVSKKVRELLR
jgi:hypothetical protein